MGENGLVKLLSTGVTHLAENKGQFLRQITEVAENRTFQEAIHRRVCGRVL